MGRFIATGVAMLRKAVIAIVLLGLLAACQPGSARRAAETDRLLAADRALAAASLEQGTAAAFYGAMTEDAMQLPAGAPPVQGRRKVRERLEALGAQVLDWTPQQAQVSRGLDLGWTWGEWRLFESAASRHQLAQGKYLKIWKRGADGRWQLAADIANQVPEAVPETVTLAAPDN